MSRKRLLALKSSNIDWIGRIKERIKEVRSGEPLFFLPGIFFMLMGFGLVFAPRILIAALACFFISCGGLFCLVVRKLLLFKRRILPMLKGIEGQVLIHKPQLTEAPRGSEEKKVLIH